MFSIDTILKTDWDKRHNVTWFNDVLMEKWRNYLAAELKELGASINPFTGTTKNLIKTDAYETKRHDDVVRLWGVRPNVANDPINYPKIPLGGWYDKNETPWGSGYSQNHFPSERRIGFHKIEREGIENRFAYNAKRKTIVKHEIPIYGKKYKSLPLDVKNAIIAFSNSVAYIQGKTRKVKNPKNPWLPIYGGYTDKNTYGIWSYFTKHGKVYGSLGNEKYGRGAEIRSVHSIPELIANYPQLDEIIRSTYTRAYRDVLGKAESLGLIK